QERRFGRIKERRLRASADARLAQRAGLLVDLEGTERRPGRERDLLERASLGEMLDGEVEAGALLRRKVEGGRLLHPARRSELPKALFEITGIVRLDLHEVRAFVAERLQERFAQGH